MDKNQNDKTNKNEDRKRLIYRKIKTIVWYPEQKIAYKKQHPNQIDKSIRKQLTCQFFQLALRSIMLQFNWNLNVESLAEQIRPKIIKFDVILFQYLKKIFFDYAVLTEGYKQLWQKFIQLLWDQFLSSRFCFINIIRQEKWQDIQKIIHEMVSSKNQKVEQLEDESLVFSQDSYFKASNQNTHSTKTSRLSKKYSRASLSEILDPSYLKDMKQRFEELPQKIKNKLITNFEWVFSEKNKIEIIKKCRRQIHFIQIKQI